MHEGSQSSVKNDLIVSVLIVILSLQSRFSRASRYCRPVTYIDAYAVPNYDYYFIIFKCSDSNVKADKIKTHKKRNNNNKLKEENIAGDRVVFSSY
jgi:hypothetical protein